jgi:hypothetical protein
MAETIVDGTQFNVENIRYSAPKAGGSGGKSVNILNKLTNSGLRMSTPLMLTWGASDFVDEKTGKGNGKYEMSLQFPSSEYSSDETDAFFNTMRNFENKIKQDALINSKEWFGKVHKNSEVVDALWTPMLKYSRDKITGEPDLAKTPVLRVKLPIWEGVWKCEIYDEDDNKLFPNTTNPCVTPLDFIQKGINVAILMQCGGLWFANGKFGITWKLIQAMVQKPKASLSGRCFIKLKPSEKEKLKIAAAAPVEFYGDEEAGSNNVEVEDSDEEEEEETPVTVFTPPAPAPTPSPVQLAVKEQVAEAIEELKDEPKKAVKKIIKKKVAAGSDV